MKRKKKPYFCLFCHKISMQYEVEKEKTRPMRWKKKHIILNTLLIWILNFNVRFEFFFFLQNRSTVSLIFCFQLSMFWRFSKTNRNCTKKKSFFLPLLDSGLFTITWFLFDYHTSVRLLCFFLFLCFFQNSFLVFEQFFFLDRFYIQCFGVFYCFRSRLSLND